MVLLSLLLVVGLGMLSLASVELRNAGSARDTVQARANARIALLQAIGQLQLSMGPDQRVSAAAGMVVDGGQEHWTGVWRSTAADGSAVWRRDEETGGLIDTRSADRDPVDEVLGWLVSGQGGPDSQMTADESIELVGEGSVGERVSDRVRVPLVEMDAGEGSGRLGWWVGDLGTRANVGLRDRHAGELADAGEPGNGGYFRAMMAQDAETAVMTGGIEAGAELRGRMASERSVVLAGFEAEWGREHFHDFTVASRGVLADVRGGGLKCDLTAYFESDGEISDLGDLPGLRDDDRMVGPQRPEFGEAEGRFSRSAPRFGVLRDWVQRAVSFDGRNVAGVTPESDSAGGAGSEELALCNESPARLDGAVRSNLGPVLVEATNFVQMSTFAKEGGYGGPLYQIRQLMYPRVVLWNPYNVELNMARAIVMIQTNGRQEMWTESITRNGARVRHQWLMFEGGRSTRFDRRGLGIMDTEGYNDPYMGSYYFSIPETKFGPGECLVFSPARSDEYSGLSVYRPGAYDLASNELSCEVAPDPSRAYYVSESEIDGGVPFRPTMFWFAPTPAWSLDGRGVELQGDDTRVVMKQLNESSSVTFEDFDRLPQLAYVSASLQYGAGREPRIAWNEAEKMPIELLNRDNPRPTVVPNVRTRDGIRLRWFDEHPSNQINSGPLSDTPYLDEAPLANWNPRGSYAARSPWDNIGGSMPVGGGASGPWFFGIYTRDLYDQAVSWQEQVPVPREGRQHGNPFGPPQEGRHRYIMFELPREETGVVSLGQLQNAKVSELVWHPSFAIGNSLVDPRLGMDGRFNTVPVGSSRENEFNGFHKTAIGWSNNGRRSRGADEWAHTARTLLHGLPEADNLVYDLSFEVNHALWDRYYVSSGSAADKLRFLEDSEEDPLPNGRMTLVPGRATSHSELTDFHRAASALMVDGAFNVNSTRVEAWKALLAAARDSGLGDREGTPFPRVLDPPDGVWADGGSAFDNAAWSGLRKLTDEEIGRLAETIVEQVRLRGPFVSLSDFVNRRLVNDELGRSGALQAALDRAGINREFEYAYPIARDESLDDYRHPDNIADATRLEQQLKPGSKAWGVPGYLTQGDLLSTLGPVLSVRSDSFVVRAYGDSRGADGRILARAWCEAVVQRVPEPLAPDETGLNPRDAGSERDFGRKFVVTSFRWLQAEEV